MMLCDESSSGYPLSPTVPGSVEHQDGETAANRRAVHCKESSSAVKSRFLSKNGGLTWRQGSAQL